MAKTIEQIVEDQNKRHRLNVEVAQHLFGLETDWDEMRLLPDSPGGEDEVLKIPMQVWSDGLWTVLTDYSGDIGAAWEVVEAMEERGWDVQIASYKGRPDPWWCAFVSFSHRHKVGIDAASPAEAICRAALRVLGRERERHGPAKSSTT